MQSQEKSSKLAAKQWAELHWPKIAAGKRCCDNCRRFVALHFEYLLPDVEAVKLAMPSGWLVFVLCLGFSNKQAAVVIGPLTWQLRSIGWNLTPISSEGGASKFGYY